MADGSVPSTTANTTMTVPGPFRAPVAPEGVLRATVTGAIPTWLRGSLVRTAPARFEVGDWRAEHWFDALALLFAFDVNTEGVTLRWRDLDCAMARELREGVITRASFGTPTRRSLLARVRKPLPTLTDNTNVNIVPRGKALVALTETPHQLTVDLTTLKVLGAHTWRDTHTDLSGTAHPVFDRTRNCWVDVAMDFRGRPAITVFEHDRDGHTRTLLGRWHPGRVPYAHSFGVTASVVLLIGHPYTLNPISMLFSNHPIVDRFRWNGRDATRLALMDRSTGHVREVEAPACFVFHVVDAFDDGDDVVLDVAAYDDASIVDALRTRNLFVSKTTVTPKIVRWRVKPGARSVIVEALGGASLEFPIIDVRARGPARRYTYGSAPTIDGEQSTSPIVQVDHHEHRERVFDGGEYVFGEPVFVARPNSNVEGDGVLLSVGSPARGNRSALVVLDAQTLAPLAHAHVDLPLPLGFHGGFVLER